MAIEAHEIGQEERDEAVVDLRGEFAEDFERLAVAERQGLAGRLGGASEPLHEAAILESGEGEAEEFFPVKARVQRRELIRECFVTGLVEPVFQAWGGSGVAGHGP